MIKVGILGAAGYTGGELIRLLLNHPDAEIVFANSESNAGNLISDVHEGLIGETDLKFTDQMPFEEVDVVFFCFGHGKSEAFLKEHTIPSQVNAITGSTGAGQKPGSTTHFSWRNNNLSIYKPFTHQHLAEIRQSLKQVQGHLDVDIDFIPYRGDFARGIFCTEVIRTKADAEEIILTDTVSCKRHIAYNFSNFKSERAFTLGDTGTVNETYIELAFFFVFKNLDLRLPPSRTPTSISK